MGYLDGFGVTIKKWFGVHTDSGKRVTLQYPEQTRPKPERFHGRHVLNRYDDGMEKCIGCELCAGVCPAKCIYVRGQDNDPDDPTSPGERFGFVYEINYLRCIHCDLCVEACPTEAITETKLFEFAFANRSDAIYTKDELLVGDDGRPQQLPWENWDGGFDPAEQSSGWMRATAPGGDADFVGIVAWAGELGYGVRAPEGGAILEAPQASPTSGVAASSPVEDDSATSSVDTPVDDDVDVEHDAPSDDVADTTPGEPEGRDRPEPSPAEFDASTPALPPLSATPDTAEGARRVTPLEFDADDDAAETPAPEVDAPAWTAGPGDADFVGAGTDEPAPARFDAVDDGDDADPTPPLGTSTPRPLLIDAAPDAPGGAADAATPDTDTDTDTDVAGGASEAGDSDDGVTDAATDDAAADDGPAPTADAPAPPSTPAPSSTAGFFDAPDAPEPPAKRRRFGRGKGDRS